MGSLLALLSALFHSPPPVNTPLQRQILGITVAGIETGMLCPGPIRLKAKKSIRAAATEEMMAQGCAMNRSRKAPVVRVALIRATDGLVIATVNSSQLVLSRGFTVEGDKALPATALNISIKDLL